ncbi:hypothetical protein AB0E59_11525 [Lentzea sp. NPDC034063]|uniref:hypothetical protein n=1 Tax=unclassified Lentzea TaxID=2643253 RepID=UPI0033EC971D
MSALEVTLRCTADPHPECRFRYVRLTVDFAATPNAQIIDLSPRAEISAEPVKLTTTRKATLSFEIEIEIEIEAVPLALEARVRASRTSTCPRSRPPASRYWDGPPGPSSLRARHLCTSTVTCICC